MNPIEFYVQNKEAVLTIVALIARFLETKLRFRPKLQKLEEIMNELKEKGVYRGKAE